MLDSVKIGWEIPQVFYSSYFWHLASLPVPPRLDHCLVMRKSGEKLRKSASILKALPDAPPDSLSIWKEGKISLPHYHLLAAGFEELAQGTSPVLLWNIPASARAKIPQQPTPGSCRLSHFCGLNEHFGGEEPESHCKMSSGCVMNTPIPWDLTAEEEA